MLCQMLNIALRSFVAYLPPPPIINEFMVDTRFVGVSSFDLVFFR